MGCRLMEACGLEGLASADPEALRWADRRRLLPVLAHAIALSPEGRCLRVASMEQWAWFVLDAETLEIEGDPLVLSEAFFSGGHAAFLPGRERLTVEWRPQRAFTGREEDHEERLVVRDSRRAGHWPRWGQGDGAARRGAPAGRTDRGSGVL
jgi:hypothetical protein